MVTNLGKKEGLAIVNSTRALYLKRLVSNFGTQRHKTRRQIVHLMYSRVCYYQKIIDVMSYMVIVGYLIKNVMNSIKKTQKVYGKIDFQKVKRHRSKIFVWDKNPINFSRLV